ncbi:MAG: hypothetical protein EOO70_07890 [Myxococcaceae bacterium]|nr:MAG: hypothetical protein EOO70_07890 [Myxococcaceae bacterium]
MLKLRELAGALLGLTVGIGLLTPAPHAAAADGYGSCSISSCEGEGDVAGGGTNEARSSGTVRETYASGSGGGQVCSVYANGTGMGAYCLGRGGGNAKSLRERFPNLVLEQCRFRPVPEGMPTPFNANPEGGRYMMQLCLRRIDLDTYSGGANRSVEVGIVWVPHDWNIEDDHNPLNEFLWNSVDAQEQLPVPFLVTRPNATPLVGTPTFFTFRWLDPGDQQVVRDDSGPYSGKDGGGPYKRIVTSTGMTMIARATKVIVDPRQKDMEAITCVPGTPYREGQPANQQPADACKMIFERSSALTEQFTKVKLPPVFRDAEAFNAKVEVHWEVTYGEPGNMRPLGNGFVMRVSQGLRVQEVQAPNQPPIVVY